MNKIIKNVGIMMTLSLFLFSSCSSSDENVNPPVGDTWETYSETFSGGDLILILNDDTLSGQEVQVSGISEGLVLVAPQDLIYGLDDAEIQATATQVDGGYNLAADVQGSYYVITLSGFISDDSQMEIDIDYVISDAIISAWDIPIARFTDSFEFTIESEYDKFKFLGDSISKALLSTTLNAFFEPIIERYVVSLSFDDDGIWNVVYKDKDEVEQTFDDGLAVYYLEEDTIHLGFETDSLAEFDPTRAILFESLLSLLTDGMEMTRVVDGDDLSLTLERETLLPFVTAIEVMLNLLVDSGQEINENLIEAMGDLAAIINSSTEFDMTVKLVKQ